MVMALLIRLLIPPGQRSTPRKPQWRVKSPIQYEKQNTLNEPLLIRDFERRTVFGAGLAVVVDFGGGDIGVP